MSVSQPQSYNAVAIPQMGEQVEDCRDYLRTGRCKYGASCKYYHPPNVQSGGGMKMPLNPTEPMFPIRPNEPVCQYFMKHGTCKFGQACKFHHPPVAQQQQYATTSSFNNAGQPRRDPAATQLVAVSAAGAEFSSHMMVQFLPQRPDEPDCIYFLKNGRCKYGATCRYHHPVHQPGYESHGRASSRPARHPQQQRNPNDMYSTNAAPKRVPYATQLTAPPGHVAVAPDGSPISFLNVDNNGVANPSGTLKPVTFMTASGEILTGTPYNVQTGTPMLSGSTARTEQGSSASSIASSFDTTGSSLDLAGTEATAHQLWSRARKNGSGGSLNAFDKARSGANNGPNGMHPSASDGSMSRKDHSGSVGSAADYNGFVNGEGKPEGWRDRSSSFDQQTVKTRSSNSSVSNRENGGDSTPTSENSSGTRPSGRPPRGSGRRSRGPGDEGFTMMTSALLTMLDTQEEASHEARSEDDGSYVTGNRHAPTPAEEAYIPYATQETGHLEGFSQMEHMLGHMSLNGAPTLLMGGATEDMISHNGQLVMAHQPVDDTGAASHQWSPSWAGMSEPPPHVMQAQSHHVQPASGTNGHHHAPAGDFGLYLP